MRTSMVIVSFVGIGLVVGTVIHLSGSKTSLDATPVVETASDTQFARHVRKDFPKEELQQTNPQNLEEPAQVSIASPASNDAAHYSVADPAPPPTPFTKAIETLVSPQVSFQQKQRAWKQLQQAGQLDQVIEALQQSAGENPTSAAYPAALGQGQLYKAGEVSRNGGTISKMGILGMQADQNFDAALTLNPANWEAQFFKAAAMSHWPLELNKGEEVIQRLSNLIDQQDTMPPQPQFAQTYVLLGDQYQRMGSPDYATATWQIGAQKFPGNPVLQQKIRDQ